MIRLLESFDRLPFLYYLWGLASLAIFAVLASRSRADVSETFRSEATFLVFCGVALFAWRWPTFFASYALTPDEGISVAGALKLTADAVPWRGFDSTPNGPLSTYVLALPALFGCRVDFPISRVLGAGLLAAAMAGLYYAFKWTCGGRIARLSLLPPVTFLSLTTQTDFVHFANEYVPMFLIAMALTATAYIAFGPGSRRSRNLAGAVAGLSIATMVFAGFQVLWIAVALLLLHTAAIGFFSRRCPREAALVASTTVGALCFVFGGVLCSVWLTRGLEDAIISYLKAPLASTDALSPSWHFLWANAKSYAFFLLACLVLVATGSAATIGKKIPPRTILLSGASGLLLLSSVYAIYQPRETLPHHLLFSVVPLSCCIAIMLHLTHEAGYWHARERALFFFYIILFAVPALSVAIVSRSPLVGYTAHNWKHRISGPARGIARHVSPGSEIVIWGWMPECYVQSQTLMATRDAQTGPQIAEGPYRDYYRERFMSDIRAHPPLVFVDAVGSDSWKFKNRAEEGHETFPALAALIAENFIMQEESGSVRIYKRVRNFSQVPR